MLFNLFLILNETTCYIMSYYRKDKILIEKITEENKFYKIELENFKNQEYKISSLMSNGNKYISEAREKLKSMSTELEKVINIYTMK